MCSNWKWELLDGPRYQGSARRANLDYPNLGLSRPDMHNVIPRTNLAYTWFNTCPGGDRNAMDEVDNSKDPNCHPSRTSNSLYPPAGHLSSQLQPIPQMIEF
ncbi:hypothetical protein ETB97_000595 [Aspergillus alliaceus]|uniref:Uncharacterized protein n=1 Tax=Petromyces alliaceus TaxID=209559 RepID=A0A5N7CM26_PETAA|nr:hypothetical protein BDV23DRAFT_178812 [Aspergillus alliaceus]KAF5861155.1 hypothetical protein ETB97_000595 [Aspergillus burnettii]